jgi:LacI family transcriptional regulator
MTLTLKKIAELAGVSRSTASRVLNDHPGVRPEVRERVLQVIREQSFQPDPAARSLASRRTATIGAAQTAENRSSDHTV